ncbi:hypothetical protein P7C73_g5054, partial [Tremellales sp. Uapishka_1]
MTTTDLPYAAEAESSLSYEELEVLRTQYYREIEQGHVTTQSKFNYGWGLVKSGTAELQTEGVKLLQDLLLAVEPENMQAQSLRTLIERAVTRDGYIGELDLGDLAVNARLQTDVTTGVGILAGAAAVTGLVLAGVLKKASRR